MTLDDGKPDLKRRLNLLALGAVVLAILLTRACSSGAPSPGAAAPAAGAPDEGTSISKDHGASTGQDGR